MSKYESMQELSQARNIIDAQRLEKFALVQELLDLKMEVTNLKVQVAKPAEPIFFPIPSTSTQIPNPSQSTQHQEVGSARPATKDGKNESILFMGDPTKSFHIYRTFMVSGRHRVDDANSKQNTLRKGQGSVYDCQKFLSLC